GGGLVDRYRSAQVGAVRRHGAVAATGAGPVGEGGGGDADRGHGRDGGDGELLREAHVLCSSRMDAEEKESAGFATCSPPAKATSSGLRIFGYALHRKAQGLSFSVLFQSR